MIYLRAVPLVLLLSTPLVHAATQTEPEVLNRYPACDYPILDTARVHQNFVYHKSSTRPEQVQKQFERLVDRLKAQAKDISASGIALTDKQIKSTKHLHAEMWLMAELIGSCDASAGDTGEPTPLNAKGERQQEVAMGSYSFEYSLTFDPYNKKQIDRPALGGNLSVGPDAGLYGLPLGANKALMLEKFGTPTFEMALSDTSQLIAYGRDHWLTLTDNELVRVRYGSSLFSGSFINHLPFDDRFDDRQWQLSPALHKGATFSEVSLPDTGLTMSSDSVKVSALTETYLVNDQKHKQVKITGFELQTSGAPTPASLPRSMRNDEALQDLADLLNSGGDSFTLQSLSSPVVGRTQTMQNSQRHLLDAYTLVETVGKSISKIYVSPGFIHSLDVQQGDWQFGDFYYGQNEQDALAAAGDTAFYLNEMLEVERDNYIARIYLEPEGDSMKVYSMEITVY